MKSFRFTLEALRVVRQRHEQKAMEKYAQTLIGKRTALDALEAVEHELARSWNEWREKMARGCTAADAMQAQVYQRSLKLRQEECARTLETAERRVNAAMQAMLIARQQREIVDKYCEHQKARYKREEARNEQKFMDDLAGRRGGNSLLTWKPMENPL